MEKLNQDFREFIELLEKHAVEYLIIGGYAVAFHGFPPYIGDIDCFVAVWTWPIIPCAVHGQILMAWLCVESGVFPNASDVQSRGQFHSMFQEWF